MTSISITWLDYWYDYKSMQLDALLAESAKEGEDKVNYREYLKAMLGDVRYRATRNDVDLL